MMKRTILLVVLVIMLVLMIFTNVDHIMWITNQSSTSNISWVNELFPLLINNIIWLAIIPLYLLWLSKKEISNFLIWLVVITVIIQISSSIYARIAVDALAAGLPFVIITIPISVILLIFSIKALKAK